MALRDTNAMVMALKAAADPTRLRILALLSGGEHNVKDLTHILGQSQPRISRHLKLLTEAGLIERAQEGSWAYFHLAGLSDPDGLPRRILAGTDPSDPQLVRDRQRAEAVRREHEASAQAYFETKAADWDTIRALYVEEAKVEAAVARAFDGRDIVRLVDLGTGTGRMLQLLAGRYREGLGLDVNRAMLAYARAKLEREGILHAQVRLGDVYNLPLADGWADAVVIHQILHYLTDPGRAIGEAARILAPGGRLVVVDFAPHQLDYLRDQHAHVRLGIEDDQMSSWLGAAGLVLGTSSKLTPPGGASDARLVVSLWTADRPAAVRPSEANTANRTMERVK
jgi:ArsR family transcriptional regulator